MPLRCALLCGFAIGARVALLWQHNANPTYNLASIPRYDDSANARRGLRALLAGDRRVTWGVLKIVRCIWAVGMADWPSTGGGRSQHYCGGLDFGLPMVAFWQHNANAKC